nr:unnamed protein product [Digitaria exilis]
MVVAVTDTPDISAFAFSFSFLTLSDEKWKKHSRTGEYTGRRTKSSSLAKGRRMGTGEPSTNHLSCTGDGVESSTPAAPPADLRPGSVTLLQQFMLQLQHSGTCSTIIAHKRTQRPRSRRRHGAASLG